MIKAISFKGQASQHTSVSEFILTPIDKSEGQGVEIKPKITTIITPLPDSSIIEDQKTLEWIKSISLTDIVSAEIDDKGVKLTLTDATVIKTEGDRFISQEFLKGNMETTNPNTSIKIKKIWSLTLDESDGNLKVLFEKTRKELTRLSQVWTKKFKK